MITRKRVGILAVVVGLMGIGILVVAYFAELPKEIVYPGILAVVLAAVVLSALDLDPLDPADKSN